MQENLHRPETLCDKNSDKMSVVYKVDREHHSESFFLDYFCSKFCVSQGPFGVGGRNPLGYGGVEHRGWSSTADVRARALRGRREGFARTHPRDGPVHCRDAWAGDVARRAVERGGEARQAHPRAKPAGGA
jgi:hypothetical protein